VKVAMAAVQAVFGTLLRTAGLWIVVRLGVRKMYQLFVGGAVIRIKAVFIQHRPHRLRGNQHDKHVDDSGAVHRFAAFYPDRHKG